MSETIIEKVSRIAKTMNFETVFEFYQYYFTFPGRKGLIVASNGDKEGWERDFRERQLSTQIPRIIALSTNLPCMPRLEYCFIMFPLELLGDNVMYNKFLDIIGYLVFTKLYVVKFRERIYSDPAGG